MPTACAINFDHVSLAQRERPAGLLTRSLVNRKRRAKPRCARLSPTDDPWIAKEREASWIDRRGNDNLTDSATFEPRVRRPSRSRCRLVDPMTERSIIMSMQSESLEVLDKAEVPPAQARAIVRAIEIEIAGAKDTLATKHDIMLLRQEMSELRGELKAEIHGSVSGVTRQMYGALLGQMALLLGIAYFFVTHVAP